MIDNTIVLAAIAAFQTIATAYLDRKIKANACGGEKCIRALHAALVRGEALLVDKGP